MLSNLTIKMKLLVSFFVIVLLIAVLSLYSIFATSKSGDGFKNYREMARDSVLAGRVQANTLMTGIAIKDYIHSKSKSKIDEFNSYFDKTFNFVQEAKKEIQKPTRAPKVLEIENLLVGYKKDFYKIISFMDERDLIKNETLDVVGKEIEHLLTNITVTAERDKDFVASTKTGKAIRSLLLARLYTAKFLDSNSEDDYKRVLNEFSELDKLLVEIKKEIQNKRRIAQLTQSINLIDKYKNGVINIHYIIVDRNKVIEHLDVIGLNVMKLTEDVKLSIKDDQDIIGPQVAELNENTKILITVISLVILVLSIIMATYISRDITKLIESFKNGLLDFFSYLNKEKNEAKHLEVDGKNEITLMADVVNSNIDKTKLLLEQDKQLIEDVKRVVNEVRAGKLNKRIEKNTQNEALQELKIIFNEMLDITSQNVAQDINKIINVLDSFSKLDFTKKVENDNGKISNGINELAKIINEMLIENKQNGLTLDRSSDILLENVNLLNRNTNEAAAALEETAAALEEITSNIINNSENVVSMANYANELSISANEGQSLAKETTKSMEEINFQVTAISDAISVIDQIAFQTNILSLNAAVEAATAGEAGKGFAVVAGEVRNLAARSAEAASEIKNLVEAATSKANNGKLISDKMIKGYTELNDNIASTLSLIKDVEMASKEQRTGIEQINDAITSLDQQTQENASIASQTFDVATQTDEIAKIVVNDANEKEFIGKNEVKAKQVGGVLNKQEGIKKEQFINENTKKSNIKSKDVVKELEDQDSWESF